MTSKRPKRDHASKGRHSNPLPIDDSHSEYKQQVKKKLYKNYFTRMHQDESELEYTGTKILNAEVIAQFKKHNITSVCDAGCGDGLFLASATAAGIDCEGFDSNEELLAHCRERGMRVSFGDFATKLPYPDESFQGIYCSNVFEHLHEPEFALHELLRILKPGGLLIISIPEANSRVFWNDWTHITAFTPKTLENLISCVDISSHHIWRRHFPVFIRHWKNPLIRIGNTLVRKGPLAAALTKSVENLSYTLRHDLVVEIKK